MTTQLYRSSALLAAALGLGTAGTAWGQCNCTCDSLVPTNQQINSVLMNEDGGSPTHMVTAGGPRNLAREVRHGNLFSGGMTITHVCIALQSPSGQPGEIANIQFYQPDSDPLNMNLPGAMIYDQQFQVSPGINGHQIVELVSPQVMGADFWVVVAYPTAQPAIPHQGTRPRTSGASAVYIGGPSLPPPHSYTVGWRYYDDMGGPGGTAGYFGHAAIIRPLNIGASGSACPYDASCCNSICSIDPSCCVSWHPICEQLALQNCFPSGCTACPSDGVLENELCGTDLNNGCDGGGAFSILDCDTTVCGTLSLDSNGLPDHDWYTIFVDDLDGTGMSFLTFNVVSEAPVEVLLQNDFCPSDLPWVVFTGQQAPVCIPQVFGGAVPSPGQYRISVRPNGPLMTCPAESHYTLWVDVDDCPTANPPVNDLCAHAGAVSLNGNESLDYVNFDATTDGPAESCGFTGVDDADMWFTYVADCDGPVVFELSSADLPDYLLAVYNECPQAGGTLLGCAAGAAGAPASVSVQAVAGETFIIRTGALNGAYGAATLSVTTLVCVEDLDGNCAVDVADLLILLGSWGPCNDPTMCPADLNQDGAVDVNDLLQMLGAWGPC